MLPPGASVTTAFFHPGLRTAIRRQRRARLAGILATRTFSTNTSGQANSIACLICTLFARESTTKVYWLNWTEDTHRFSSYNKEIVRSALVLKLLMYEKTGAVLAAATTSLPETLGEIRNWDYRFCWLRDAYFVLKALNRIGAFVRRHDKGGKA